VQPISRLTSLAALSICTLLCVGTLRAQSSGVDVTAHVNITPVSARKPAGDLSNVVVWLVPTQPVSIAPPSTPHPPYQLLQKDKQFHPHLLVVPVGSSVEFPNADPFFHNVFSLFNGKRFDLGLYEAGAHRYVRFDHEGVSYIFCNIHPEMGAVILSLSTPFYAISAPDGSIVIHDVPPGSYQLHAWSENAQPVASSKLLQVGTQNLHLDEILLRRSPSPLLNHKNKFGEDYHSTPTSPY